ncbi:MAG: hypothetical protein LBR00_06730 [Clostridiales Family XIII bacterium]|nr:hypothetical protein [Clostridiales Family XIII bacterium]
MDIKKLKQEYRIRQWSVVVAECQRSGMSVSAWCESQGICRQTYYYWQKRVREAAVSDAFSTQESEPCIVPAAAPSPPPFVQIVPRGSAAVGAVAMVVRIGATECEIMNGADIDVIERAILALGKIC